MFEDQGVPLSANYKQESRTMLVMHGQVGPLHACTRGQCVGPDEHQDQQVVTLWLSPVTNRTGRLKHSPLFLHVAV